MNDDIRFRVERGLRRRAEKVVRLRSAGKPNPETLSTFGREGFFHWLIQAERDLGLDATDKGAAA